MELNKLQEIVSDILDIDKQEIQMDTDFIKDLGADSIDLFQIITAIESEFNIEFEIEKANEIITVADAIEEIKRLINN